MPICLSACVRHYHRIRLNRTDTRRRNVTKWLQWELQDKKDDAIYTWTVHEAYIVTTDRDKRTRGMWDSPSVNPLTFSDIGADCILWRNVQNKC